MLLLITFLILGSSMADIRMRTGNIKIAQAPRTSFFFVFSVSKSVTGVARYDANIHMFNANELKQSYLVSFQGPVMPDHKIQVENVIGHALTQYLPDHAFLVFCTPSQASQASSLPNVAFVGPLESQHKVTFYRVMCFILNRYIFPFPIVRWLLN